MKSSATVKPAAVKKSAAAAGPKSYIVIDYPKEGEKFYPHHYSIRIGAGGGENVEISFDGGEWTGCRNTAGYFWFDWHSIASGSHKITARLKLADGKFKKSKAVRCEVY